MSLIFQSVKNIESGVPKTPLYTLYDDQLLIKQNKEKTSFDLNEISNVRYSKKRNFLINFVLLFCILAIYCVVSDYLNANSLNNILLLVITIVFCLVSLSVGRYNHMLFITNRRSDHKKLSLAKKDVPHALQLIALFKSGYLIKCN